MLALTLFFAWPNQAQESGVKVLRQEPLPQGQRIVLAVAPPETTIVTGPDGKPYSRLAVKGSGTENEFGHPALPFVHHVCEVPAGLKVSVRAVEQDVQVLKVPHPLWPHQKPVPKLPEAKARAEFLVEAAAYSGTKAEQFQKAWNGDLQVLPYRKRGRDFVDIIARPFAYQAATGEVRYPAELVLELTYAAPDLPKVAGPRPGGITVVEVVLRGKGDLEWLDREGFNFELRDTSRAEVFATKAEVRRLKEAGLKVRELGRQPSPLDESPKGAKGLGVYHDYAAFTAQLQDYTNRHPEWCRLISIGRSVQNRELWAMKLTSQPDLEQGKPRVRLAGTMHGDEPLGVELCLYFIDLLANASATNARVANLLATTEIWVLPLLNPDGHATGTHFNASGYDLNRSFPDGGGSGLGNPLFGPPPSLAGRPPEVVSLMQFSTNRSFTLAANLHAGALVVNYPYDDDELGAVNSPTPDDAMFRFVSLEYSTRNLPMWSSSTFPQGIVNGAAWYVVDGGLQDWSYRYLGCNEVTLELSTDKQPPASQIPQFWEDNRDALLSYIETVHTGAWGFVTDAANGQPVYAAVKALGIQHGVFSDPRVGDYHRMLLPGTYHLVFTAPDYATHVVSNVVVQAGQSTRLDVALQRAARPPERILLVSSDSLSASLPALSARKTADGFEVQDVVVADGTPTNRIRSLVRDAYAIFPADYVLIVGDTPQVPPFMDVHPTDLPYALMDAGETTADYLGKDTVLGRVSLRTPAAIGEFAQKVATFAQSLSNRVGDLTWVSHGYSSSEYAQAERGHDYCINNCIPPANNNTRLYENIGSASVLTAHINAGTDGVIYSGHAGEFNWVRYDYGVTALAGLNNIAHVPVVIGHCCVAGSFDETVCFGEAWLQTTARGITYVGATDNTYWDEDEWMQMGEFDAMSATRGVTVGKAIDEGLYRVHERSPASARYYHTAYHVLGDPTVVMFDAVPLPLTIRTAAELPAANKGLPYSTTLRTSGGEPPYAWSVIGGALPGGLSLNAAGVIAGTASSTSTNQFTVQVADSGPTQQVATATFTLPVWDLSGAFNQALDTADWPWGSGGGAYWQTQSATTHNGEDAAQSGPISHSQQTWLETVVHGPGTLSFWWKVSSESGFDFLEFHLNGTLQDGRISGDVDWQAKTYTLGDGPQTLRWRYTKDGSVNALQDCGWLDQVRFFTNPVPDIVTQPQSTTVTAGDTATFTVTAVGTAPLRYQWYNEGLALAGATTSACLLPNVQPGQPTDFWVVITNQHGAITSAVAQLTVVTGISLAGALDQQGWTWITGGNAVWRGQSAITHDGSDAAQCGDISDDEESWLQTTVLGPGQLSFWWKVSSESGYDFLEFTTNGVSAVTQISGNVDWQMKTLRLPEGAQTLRWSYAKDSSDDDYQDLAWVDQVTWTPDPPFPTILQPPQNAVVCVGDPAIFTVSAGGEKPLAYQWLKGTSIVARANAPTYSILSAQYSDAGLYAVQVTNALGAITSAPALLTVLPPGGIATNTFLAGNAIIIPSYGTASPYPSTLFVSNLAGEVRRVTVTLHRLSHTYASDLEILLAGPSGPPILLMSWAGGGDEPSNVTLTFDDQAPLPLSDTELTSGTYRPTDFSNGESLPYPAPARPYGSALSAYQGTNPNGTWRLYVADTSSGDAGSLAGGWSLRIVTAQTETPPLILNPRLESGRVQFQFIAPFGKTCCVEYREALNQTGWHTLETLIGDGSLRTCSDAVGTGTQRFYRLRVE